MSEKRVDAFIDWCRDRIVHPADISNLLMLARELEREAEKWKDSYYHSMPCTCTCNLSVFSDGTCRTEKIFECVGCLYRRLKSEKTQPTSK